MWREREANLTYYPYMYLEGQKNMTRIVKIGGYLDQDLNPSPHEYETRGSLHSRWAVYGIVLPNVR
jgi:hypothetical protein